ncbi:MAG: hypothetical protein IJD79_01490 [Clostridia bacterium]|nr:hypothetical protein [Clostridia bacterium]
MKKIFALLLTCLLCLSAVGCSEKPYQAAWDGFCYTATEHQAVEMKSEDRKYIINLLNEAVWETNIEDCECDFYFSLQRQRVEYHSECGTFNDITNGKSTKVAEDQRLKINTILNLDAAKEKVGTVTDFSKFSNMTRETSKIEVTFDNNTGAPFYFTIEDQENIYEIMNIIFTDTFENMGEEVNDGNHSSIKIIQGERIYDMSLSANKEGKYYYSFSTTDLYDKIIELAREAGAFEGVE